MVLHPADSSFSPRILYRKYYQHASTASMLQVYLACIRPDLEYAAPVWSPHQQGLKDQIEGVQKLALKICTKQWTTSYSTLLTLTRVPSSEKRRQILKLCYIFKILNNIYTFPEPRPLQLQSMQWRSQNKVPQLQACRTLCQNQLLPVFFVLPQPLTLEWASIWNCSKHQCWTI